MIPAVDVPIASSSSSHDGTFNQCSIEATFNGNRDDKSALEDVENLCSNELSKQAELLRFVEKSVIIHKDENGFGLQVKGQNPVFIEHVHENGAAWRAGVRKWDQISKINGQPVNELDHKDVVLMFKSCTRIVGLTLLSVSTKARCGFEHRDINCGKSVMVGEVPALNYLIEHPDRDQQFRNRIISDRTQLDSYCKAGANRYSSFTGISKQQHKLLVKHHNSFFAKSPNLTGQVVSRLIEHSRLQKQSCDSPPSTASRRSESVSIGCSCSAFEQTATQHNENTYYAKNRRTSLSEPESNQVVATTGSEISGLQSVCINCRAPVNPEHQALHELVNCCDLCHIKYNPLVERIRDSVANQDDHQRQRIYGSLRDPRQQQLIEVRVPNQADVENNNNKNPDQSRTHFYKLSQSTSANSLPIEVNITKSKVTNKRMEIIRELIDTEKTHTERLRCLDELFYRPLKTGGLMTSEQLRMVFSCHRTLYKIHRQIYRILLSANYNLYNEPMIGSALLEIFEGDLKRRLERAACSFCADQSTNIELLNKLTRRDTKVGEFIAQVTSQQVIGRLGIKDLLASCFQRLTKYPLLLENLLKATPQSPADIFGQTNQNLGQIMKEAKVDGEDEEEGVGVRNSRRMLAISLAEEREFIERALNQSRQILVKVNESVKVSMSHNKLKEIWKRTDKYPGVPLIDITKQQVVHEGLLTLRLSKRSFDVYVLLLNDYIIILTREGQDKYRLKFFTPEGKSSSSSSGNQQSVYSPVFVIDEHLTTRDAATDENGFYLLCKRKDDSRIYEFASRSPAERLKWRDRIQWTIDCQMSKGDKRRASFESTITKSSSDISARQEAPEEADNVKDSPISQPATDSSVTDSQASSKTTSHSEEKNSLANSIPKEEPTNIVGTISYVEDDGIVMPSKMESSRALVDQAVAMNIFDRPKRSIT